MIKKFINYVLLALVVAGLTVTMFAGFMLDILKYILTGSSKAMWKLADVYLDWLISLELSVKKFKGGLDKVKKM